MTEPKYGNYLSITTNYLITVECKTDDFRVEELKLKLNFGVDIFCS